MQVSVEAGEGLERRMKIDLPFEQIAVEVEKRLQQFARNARLPGFRPGKVPMKLLRQRFGDRLYHEVFGELVQSSFVDALTQESLQPAGMPQIEPAIDLEGQKVGFTAIFEVMPEFELAPLSGRVVKRPVCELKDDDFDTMMLRLREQRKTWSAVERPCQLGDRVEVSFTGTLDGEAFEGGSATGIEIELGSGRMIPGFEEGLVGMAPGEERSLDLTFPESYQAAHLAGKQARFEVTLTLVEEPRLPEIDAELAQSFGIEDGDVERFASDVKANMERELAERVQARTKEAVMDLLFEAHQILLPSALVQREAEAMAEQMTKSFGGGKLELPHTLFESGARRRVALGLILGKIVKEQGLVADPQRVRSLIEQMAATYDQPQAFIDYYYRDRERLGTIETRVLEDQVVDFVLAQVSVEDEVVDFATLTSGA